MPKLTQNLLILVAEDDPDDRLLIQSAFEENNLSNPLLFVEDGEALMDYLCWQESYATREDNSKPGIIILDLNMPRKSGRQALHEIKSNPELRSIPVIVLTTSSLPEDIQACYDAGANSFVCKPVTFEKLGAALKTIEEYWFRISVLPSS